MHEEIVNFIDTVGDDELLRRYFFLIHYDSQLEEWSYNTFQLRNITPPEDYLSLTRVGISPDAVEHAKKHSIPINLRN